MAMLELNDIKKDYAVAGEKVSALKGISLKFRKSEFVSILGPSGCGKTTLLNIIGGLDKYTSGDLIIEGRSTKQYDDRDWDTYRNHSIGFIFQSYHLIPHQTILQNVELALTISGISRQERRERAIEALEKVGLKDKIHNRPNQLSGGQAQRVAIARALINDPEIVLADEPTGALDSVTSVQIMELLKEISKDRLIIMVTHNPELAEQYSTRIVRLLDGLVVDDTMPYDGVEEPAAKLPEPREEETAGVDETEPTDLDVTGETKQKSGQENRRFRSKGKKKKTSMSVGMAMALSCKNLLSKSKRTAMVSVAGSIGIIGVSLVLAISAGVQNYINDMENDMLSGNPVAITRSAVDFSSMMNMSVSSKPKVDITKLDDKLYVRSLMDTLGTFAKGLTKTNNITEQYLDYVSKMDAKLTNVVQYGYEFNPANNIYTGFKVTDDTSKFPEQVISVTGIRGMYSQILSEQEEYKNFTGTISSISTFGEVPDNYEYIFSQFDVVAYETKDGVSRDVKNFSDERKKEIFADPNSLIMVVDDSMITDIALGQYGYLTEQEFLNYAFKAVDGTNFDKTIGLVGSGLNSEGNPDPENGFDLSEFIGPESKKFTYYSNNEAYAAVAELGFVHRPYVKNNFAFKLDASGNPVTVDGVQQTIAVPDINTAEGKEMGVKLILQKKGSISYSCLEPGVYYTKAHTDRVIKDGNESAIVNYIKNLPEKQQYLPMLPYFFNYTSLTVQDGQITGTIKPSMSFIYDGGNIMDMMMSGLSDPAERAKMMRVTAQMLGGSDLPASISIYPKDFGAKNKVCDYLTEWNNMCSRGDTYSYNINGVEKSVVLQEDMKITYTDTVGMIINMVNTMIQMITIALVAFTALSLVVSTVMIGIITYVSVVERIKEIGILRAVGARKMDIKRLFNAETFIIGLVAGLFGILITYILSLIVNIIVSSIAGIWGIAALPWWQALIMVIISVGLTLISGLIPASAAAKKDPVVALRTE